MKKVIEIVVIVLIVGILGYIFITKNNEEKEVINYVNKNYSKLEYAAKNNTIQDKYIKRMEENNNLVIFYVKDKVGFYYSKEDLPKAIDGDANLLGLGDNKYSWNNGTIIKIRDNWYYFKLK